MAAPRHRKPRLSRRTAAAACSGLVALALAVPLAPPAAADVSPAVITGLDNAFSGLRWLSSFSTAGTGTSRLTPVTHRTYAFDVSDDGNTLVAGMGYAQAYPSSWDRSYGLVLLRRGATGTSSLLLASDWDTNPVVSSDGSTVWWMTGGAVWKHTDAGTVLLQRTLFAPKKGEDVEGMAVSPDGLKLAVSYGVPGTPPASMNAMRWFAADLTSGKASPWWQYDDVVTSLTGELPVWADDAHVLWPGLAADSTVWHQSALSPLGSGSWSAMPDLDGVYALRRLGGQWWGWREEAGGTQVTAVAALADFPSGSWQPMANGGNTFDYRPSLSGPPAFVVPSNRPTPVPSFFTRYGTILSGTSVAYLSYATYLTPLPGQTLAKDGAEVDRGLLEMSLDGVHWRSLGATSWAHPVPWPGTTYQGSGMTPKLTRNTWFRWHVVGDDLLRPSGYAKQKVIVSPRITLRLVRTSRGIKVSGTAARTGGTALLQRQVGKAWRTLATVKLAARGAFAFAARPMSRGAYRVMTPAGGAWGMGTAGIRIT